MVAMVWEVLGLGPISAVHELNSREKFSAEPGIEPGAAGWETRTLPKFYAVPQIT